MSSDRSARLIGSAFTGAGVMHFARPDFFEAIVPRWFPSTKFANEVSGGAEIICGLAMFPRRTRRVAAFGLLGILIGVFPANVDMWVNNVKLDTDDAGKAIRVGQAEGVRAQNTIRLPFQFLFAWLVWRHTRESQAVNGSDL